MVEIQKLWWRNSFTDVAWLPSTNGGWAAARCFDARTRRQVSTSICSLLSCTEQNAELRKKKVERE
jgi:hypothetical protein